MFGLSKTVCHETVLRSFTFIIEEDISEEEMEFYSKTIGQQCFDNLIESLYREGEVYPGDKAHYTNEFKLISEEPKTWELEIKVIQTFEHERPLNIKLKD